MEKILTDEEKYSDFNSEVIPHRNMLKRYAVKLTRDYDNSEDLLQDTLLKAFRFLKSYEKGTNVKAWLFKIMQNSFINDCRKNVKQADKVDYDDVQNFYENINGEDVKITHYRQDEFENVLNDEIYKALSVLPDEFLTTILLCDIEGYTYKEISDFVGCPIGTIRSRLHRTRKILYSQLYEYANANGYLRKREQK